jgi:ABC-type multidrug transport system permease subunit
MWYGIGGLGALLYVVLIVTLGVATIRNGHWVLFILGIFLPIFWIVGALMRPTPAAA